MSNDILNSWNRNAKEWDALLEGQGIPSRKYTNTAIVEAIRALGLKKVADLGCGEGWLCREMGKNQIEAFGFDATAALIELANTKGSERYEVMTYEQIIKGTPIPHAPFDGAIFNFSLYQKDNLDVLLQQVLHSIDTNGAVLIQTLHPYYLIEQGLGYKSQWLSDAWKGLPGNFKDGHSWYARTLDDWMALLAKIPQTSFQIQEIVNTEEKPLSVLIILKKQDG